MPVTWPLAVVRAGKVEIIEVSVASAGLRYASLSAADIEGGSVTQQERVVIIQPLPSPPVPVAVRSVSRDKYLKDGDEWFITLPSFDLPDRYGGH